MKNAFSVLTIIGFALLLVVLPSVAEDISKDDDMGIETPKSVEVGNKICPVSGEKIGSGGMEAATYEYQDKIYNLCCAACIEEFKKDPEKYIKKTEEQKEEIKEEPKRKSAVPEERDMQP